MKRIGIWTLLIFTFQVNLASAVSVFYPPSTLSIMNKGSHKEFQHIDMTEVDNLLKMYDRTIEANKYVNGAASSFGSALNTAIDVVDVGAVIVGGATANLPGLVSAAIITNGMKSTVNGVVKGIEDHGEHLSKQYIIGAIDNTYKRVPNLQKLSPEDQYLEIMKTRKFEDKILGKVIENHEHNAIFQTFMMRAIRSEVVELAMKNAGSHKKTQDFLIMLAKEQLKQEDMLLEQRNEIFKKMDSIGDAIIKLENKQLENQQIMMAAQAKMISSINILATEVINQHVEISETNGNVKAIKEVMFSKMSLQEQKERLSSGFMDDVILDPKKKQALQSRIEFQATFENVMQTGKYALSIAQNLGINSPIINDISKGMAAVEAGTGLAMAISTSNPMGVLSNVCALTGVFAKGKPDPAAERHSEIMKGFKALSEQIAEGNKAILGELNTIEKMLTVVNSKIDDINDKLSEVNEKLRVMNKYLYSIDRNIIKVANLIKSGNFKNYLLCENRLIEPLKELKSYSSFEAFLNPKDNLNISDRMKQCITGFDLIFARDKQSEFFENFSKTEARQNYDSLLEILRNDFGSINLSKILKPSTEYSLLGAKKDFEEQSIAKFTWESMLNYLDVRVVSKVVEDYLVFYPITYMFTRNCQYPFFCKFLTLDEMNSDTEHLFPGSTMDNLKNALTLVQIAIAQQTMASGDLAIYSIIEKLKQGADEYYLKKLKDLLADSPNFAHNFFIVYIKNWIEENNPRSDWYRIALGASKTRQLIDALKLPYNLKFESTNGVNSVYFETERPSGVTKVYLPSDKEVRDGVFKLNPELIKLLQLREKVIAAIVDIRVMEKVKESSNKNLKKAYLELVH